MKFTENSQLVKDYVLLIKAKEKAVEDVPNVGNLREVVANVLEQSK